ncbi:hypothetical protein [Mycolicibacterium conceptionense]|uniref:hypothetical protein n=1 Tax=Mycolicibacterium conceptionense TaxID=451644 RepID=UPI000A6230A3|nr:hypothetical protein [Mycolicibacterium conceptionense]
MKNGIPSIYWSFRYAWSIAHLVMVVVLGVSLAAWLIEDDRGAQMFNTGYYWVQDLSYQLASLIPFPWG